MKVAVNTRLLLKDKQEGIGYFASEILSRMCQNNPEVEFHFLFDRPYHKDFIFSDNIVPHVVPPPTRHPILWNIWLNYSLPFVLKKIKPDVFFSPDGFLPKKTSIKCVNTIHDINFHHFPEDLNSTHAHFYRKHFPIFAHNSDAIVTVSHFSKTDLIQHYQVPERKISVIYNGVDHLLSPISDIQKNQIRNTHTHGKEYMLFIGSIQPRKNIKRMLLAFDKYRETSSKEVDLVILGEKKWWTAEMTAIFESMKHQSSVVFLGHLPRTTLREIVAASSLLVYVSTFEGFGMPILEGFACGVPVLTSNTSSMPEVAGSAALLVDPYEVNSIKDGMTNLMEDPILRGQLIEKGYQQLKKFNWDKSAQMVWELIKKQCD